MADDWTMVQTLRLKSSTFQRTTIEAVKKFDKSLGSRDPDVRYSPQTW
jgi:hypothetical protein